MRIEFLGAAHVVTGSCYLLHVGDHRYLVDCGMYQGTRRLREMNYEEFPFNPAEIEAVFLTHAHIDHCGRIPRLVREGFRGKVYATQSTCDLVRIMLPDSAHIQESDTELFNRKMHAGAKHRSRRFIRRRMPLQRSNSSSPFLTMPRCR